MKKSKKWLALLLSVTMLGLIAQLPATATELTERKALALKLVAEDERSLRGVMYNKSMVKEVFSELSPKADVLRLGLVKASGIEVVITDMKPDEKGTVWYYYREVAPRPWPGVWVSSNDVILVAKDDQLGEVIFHGMQVDKDGNVWGDIGDSKEIKRVYIGNVNQKDADRTSGDQPGPMKATGPIIALFVIIIKLISK